MTMEVFVETHAALILRLARGVARPPLHAEDVAQEVVAALLHWNREGRLEPEHLENAEAYLRVVARNVASLLARKQRSEVLGGERAPAGWAEGSAAAGMDPPVLGSASSEDRIVAREQLERLKANLRPRDALVLSLLVEDGLSMERVATALAITMNNLHQITHRIRAAALELLDADASQEGQ